MPRGSPHEPSTYPALTSICTTGPSVQLALRTLPEQHARMPEPLTRERILETARLLRPHVRRTPVIELSGTDFGLPACQLYLKLELTQHSGSFKVRGAFANLLTRDVPEAGVVAASGGNHGAAVAFAARRLEKKAQIFVPRIASPAKVERIRREQAMLEIGGERYADALAASHERAAKTGALEVHAYDAIETLLGTGSMAAELEDQAPALEAVLVPVGGGGLIAGFASWYAGRARVVGVEPELAPTLARALDAGHPVDVDVHGIAADSLGARRIGAHVFPVAQRHVERVVLLEDTHIRAAQEALWDKVRIVAEPGGAAALAALLSGRYPCRAGERLGVVVSGGNTVAVDFDR
ncbi:MAG TPA: threonine/serine dehydratase [Polyangiaceae bacterium]|nr:threonine/serine dehydratase [Polyangiaceae bacterium]